MIAPSDRQASFYGNVRELRDPASDIRGMAPNFGRELIPHVVTFQGLLGAVSKVYRPSDEALKESYENAKFMRNDLTIMECVEPRSRSTALLNWHLEPENPKNSKQKELADELTTIIKQIPRFMQYRENLLHGLWFGRYGVKHRWGWSSINGKMRCTINKWTPVHGDKLVFRFDDGDGQYDDDQIGIRVGTHFAAGHTINGLWNVEKTQIEPTEYGLAYFLTKAQRPLLAVHKHYIEDGEYEDPRNAGRIHGLGIRSRIYWSWYQKQETLALMMDYIERSALGFEIWYYPWGNAEAEAKTRRAATERIGEGRNIILVPRPIGEDTHAYGVERIETGGQGVDVLDRVIREYFGHQIKRYILGQTLTSEASATGLGSGLSELHLDTYLQIIRYDSTNLEETITTDLVNPLKLFNFPQYASVPVRFKIDTEAPDVESKLEAWKKAFEMGLKLKAQDVADLIGAARPSEGDETLDRIAQEKAAAVSNEQAGASVSMNGVGPDAAQLLEDLKARGVASDGPEADRGPEADGGERAKIGDLKAKGPKARYRDNRGESDKAGMETEQATDHRAGSKSASGRRWITIGGDHHDGEGGTPVLVDGDGTIHGGPKGLKGKKLGDLDRDVAGSEKDGRTKPNRDAARAAAESFDPNDFGGYDDAPDEFVPKNRFEAEVANVAEDYGVSPHDLKDAAEYVWTERRRLAEEREHAKAAARTLTGLTQGDVNRMQNQGLDYSSGRKAGGHTGAKLAHFDSFAQEIAREHPELGLGDPDSGDDFASELWRVLGEGKQPLPAKHDQEILKEAANLVLANSGQHYEPEYAEAFARSGLVLRYAKRKPAAGQGSLFSEEDHPRDADGKFTAGAGDSSTKVDDVPEPEIDSVDDSEDEPFSLSNDKGKTAKPDFGNNTGKQKSLLSGLDALPGQQDLFEGMDNHSDDLGDDFGPNAEETPREAADRQAEETAKSEYAFARASAVPNAGEDLLGSARHKVNAWRSLEAAEADGTAEQQVTRDQLLKNEPHDILSTAHADNFLTPLAMHYSMMKFPAKPYDPEHRYYSKQDEDRKKLWRKQYVEAYGELRDAAQKLAEGQSDPKRAMNEFSSRVGKLISKCRQEDDSYNPVANGLVATYNNTREHSRNSTSVRGQMNEFAKRLQSAEPNRMFEDRGTLERGAEAARDIMEGASLNKAFGTKSDKKKTFDAAEAYVKVATRKGGRVVDANSVRAGVKFMTSDLGMRGVQWGNSVTDSEREHHLKFSSEAMADLVDVLGLDDSDASLGGKLGLAIGARGHGTAMAHYEPLSRVINLTRKSGVGSLAHEWGHFFDHEIAGGQGADNYYSEQLSKERFVKDENGNWKTDEKGKMVTEDLSSHPMRKAYDDWRAAFADSGFKRRLSGVIGDLVRSGQISEQKRGYWYSMREVFARSFERHVQHKLKSADRENTYLAGNEGHPLWPTDEEVAKMAPAFDGIFAAYKQHKSKPTEVAKHARDDEPEAIEDQLETGDDLTAALDAAVAATKKNPSEAQREAGNYPKGRMRLHGLPITIETPQGATRKGTDADGNDWSVEMPAHYGYIRQTESEADGDHIDLFIGPDPSSELVFVVDQRKPSGRFDEHKVMIGWHNAAEAKEAYLSAYSEGWDGLGAITPLTLPQLKEWLANGDSAKPLAE